VRVAETVTASIAAILSSIATSMVTETALSAITMTVTRFGTYPIRVRTSNWRPAGSTSRALPLASVVAL
jgi:hypothetical protein